MSSCTLNDVSESLNALEFESELMVGSNHTYIAGLDNLISSQQIDSDLCSTVKA